MTKFSARSAWSWLRKYWLNLRRVRFWLVAVFILYTLIGFLVLPWIVRSYATHTLDDDLGRDLRIGSIHTNPFTLDLEVDDLALDDIDGQELIGFERLFVDLAWSSLFEWTVVIPTARLKDARLHEERFKSGETRFTRLLSEIQNRPLPREGKNGDIIRPEQSGPTMPIALENIDCSLDDFIYADDAVSSFQVSGQSELGGNFSFDGEIQLLPELDLAGTVDVDSLALAIGEPFAQRFAKVRIDSGSLSTEGELHSGPDDPLSYTGSARVDGLAINERDGGEDVLGWQAMIIDGVDLNLEERLLDLSIIQFDQLSARVFIAEDRSTNLGELLVERPAAPKAEPEDEAEPFDIAIGGARLDNGILEFTDRSLPLPFSAHVQKLQGDISRLSSVQEGATRVDLKGQVAEYGSARISGEADPWDLISHTRFDLVFENMDIPDLTPYAVQFTGRRISAGRMDLDLGYVLDDGYLEISNHIILRDLMLGERIEHPDATELPLRLAITLLKDREGVIGLDIPLKGQLNDAEFSFGSAIRQSLTDILQSIISSPFKMLASLVDGDADQLAKVAFAPGSSKVGPPQRRGLDQLRMALRERPELAIELPAPYAPDTDHPALQRQGASVAMVDRLDRAGKDVANPSLKAAETSETLEAMFVDRYPQRALADVRERFTTTAGVEGKEFDATAYREQLATEVTSAQTVTKEDLEALAQARADAVRDRILGEGNGPPIDPERVRAMVPLEVKGNGEIVLRIGLATN